jgi:alanyl-tRNA synthetase
VFGARGEAAFPGSIVLQGLPRAGTATRGELAKIVSGRLGGGGGGKPDLAQGQGKDPAGVPDVLRELDLALRAALGAAAPDAVR